MTRSRPGADLSAFSRRAFLKGASATAVGTAVTTELARGAQVDARPARARRIASGPNQIELAVNGETMKVDVETRTTLLDALRDSADLTGAKKICDRGACGGCTVLVDDQPINSCLMLAHDAVGHEIRTVEGLADGDDLHPVQAAFVECDALQCGFCTPGMVMSSVACIETRGQPTLDEIKHDLSGNICRCGTYTRIFEAVQQASGQKGGK